MGGLYSCLIYRIAADLDVSLFTIPGFNCLIEFLTVNIGELDVTTISCNRFGDRLFRRFVPFEVAAFNLMAATLLTRYHLRHAVYLHV